MPSAAPVDPAALELRDIHLPDPVGWWPPAPGWWLLAAVALALMLAAVLGLAWYRRRRRAGAGTYALAVAELDAIASSADAMDDRTLAAALSELLRRTVAADADAADTHVATLTGGAWLEALDQTLADGRFTRGVGAALVNAPYMRESAIDRAALLDLARDWLQARRDGAGAAPAPDRPAAREQAA